MPVILSHVHVTTLLNARRRGQSTAHVSLDLGLSYIEVRISLNGIELPNNQALAWPMIEEIMDTPNGCFVLEDNTLRKIQVFSEETGLMCSLMPTQGAPTLLVGGFPMHRIKDVEPKQDTIHKIQAIHPVMGRILDTATGLGYTAILASQTAEEVITVEIDPSVLEVARYNPWSTELFHSPKITQLVGDSSEVITEFPTNYFNRVVHDPPTFSLAGQLYSQSFYQEVYRVLTKRGRLFHYVGDPASNFGRRIAKGVVQRLRAVGFQLVKPFPQAFGVVAYR